MDLRRLPQVDQLSRAECLREYPEAVRTEAARRAVAHVRERLLADDPPEASVEEIAEREAMRLVRPGLRPAINLSGVVLHTGLGRARLAPAAAAQLREAGEHHAVLEFDLEEGVRGDRQDHVRGHLQRLTGCDDAYVVNNAAAGVVLALAALAGGREVVLSRGQMVEIGGAFRMPEIVETSGCRLVEVGCTNKTRLSDYERALGDETGAILRCHTSNYRIVGFTAQPERSELAALAQASRIPFIDDAGSGCLVDTRRFGLPKEPTLQECVAAGADVVIASGDKMLGGPQAGMILGRKEMIDTIRKHPLARAFRIDKLTLAALEATLRLYVEGREMEIPTLRYLGRSLEEVRATAERLCRAVGDSATVEASVTEVGGGSAPGTGVPTCCAVVRTGDPERWARALRTGDPPIVGRIQDGALWLDPRTVEPDEVERVERALGELATS
jgi:L-seryl-tRNA(Ser) seleniumtransferase